MKNVIANVDKRQSVSLADFNKQSTTVRWGNPVLYALIFVAAAVVISLFLSVVIIPGTTSILPVLAPAGSFAFIGLLFAGFLYTRLRFLSDSDYKGGIVYALVVFAGIFIASFVTGYFKGNESVTTSLFYSSLFILPFTIYQSWLCYSKLLFFSYNKIWYLPEQATKPPKRATVFLNSIHITVKIPAVLGGAEYMYDTTVPGRISVGEMFSDMVNVQTGIEAGVDAFEDINDEDYGWQFFVPSLLGLSTRQLDAEASLDENKIKNNGVVIAKRILKPVQLSITENINQN